MRRAIDRRGPALLVYFVVLLGFGLGISGAAAHSRLVKSDPSARAVLDTAPKELKLWFNEGVEPAFAKVWIVPAQGAQIPLTSQWRQFQSAASDRRASGQSASRAGQHRISYVVR